jgi:hypothetical protein
MSPETFNNLLQGWRVAGGKHRLMECILRGCIQKFSDWPPGARTAIATALCHWVQLYRYYVSQPSDLCRVNPLCCFSTSITKGKRIFLYDSVRKLLDIPSYTILLTSVNLMFIYRG